MQVQEVISATKKKRSRIQNRDYRSNYRRQVIAEIIDYGRAACKIESIFQDQIKCWSNVLSEIPTEKLFDCYVVALRDRDEMFDKRSLTAGELLVAMGRILNQTKPLRDFSASLAAKQEIVLPDIFIK